MEHQYGDHVATITDSRTTEDDAFEIDIEVHSRVLDDDEVRRIDPSQERIWMSLKGGAYAITMRQLVKVGFNLNWQFPEFAQPEVRVEFFQDSWADKKTGEKKTRDKWRFARIAAQPATPEKIAELEAKTKEWLQENATTAAPAKPSVADGPTEKEDAAAFQV